MSTLLPTTQAEAETPRTKLTPAQAEWKAAYQRLDQIPEAEWCDECYGIGGWLDCTSSGEDAFRQCTPCDGTGRRG
ncbi:hypothetical protein OG495_37155 (plasmid) [Streptomyces longwoodensis]|uniref:hypothetical protein n=1 Tax=Streptomyces longwoodensis TaxID=68231 RepID=UPI002F9181A1